MEFLIVNFTTPVLGRSILYDLRKILYNSWVILYDYRVIIYDSWVILYDSRVSLHGP